MGAFIGAVVAGIIGAAGGILANWIDPPDWATPKKILVLILGLVVVGALVGSAVDGGTENANRGWVSPTNGTLMPSSTALPPTSTGPLVPNFTPSQEPPLAPGEQRYRFIWADATVADFDSGTAAQPEEGGSEYEAELNFGRLYTAIESSRKVWGSAKVVYIDASQASYDGCQRGTQIQKKVAFLRDVEANEMICIRTNRGAWAVLKIEDAEPSSSGLGTGDVTFSVRLFSDT